MSKRRTYRGGNNGGKTFDREEWAGYSHAAKFFDVLGSVMKTPDGRNYALVMEDHCLGDYVAGVVQLDCIHNHALGKIWSLWNVVHIRSIVVCNHFRGIGFLGSICSLLQYAANEAGVFVCGTAKPFRHDMPIIQKPEELIKFLGDEGCVTETFRIDEKKKNDALALREKYISNGFCAFDSAGYPFLNKFWKKTGFGYLGEGTPLSGHEDYFDRHLKC